MASLEKKIEPRARETHQDTGGSAPDESSDTAGWPKDMNRGTQRFYQDQINKGIKTQATAIAAFNYKPKHGSRAA